MWKTKKFNPCLFKSIYSYKPIIHLAQSGLSIFEEQQTSQLHHFPVACTPGLNTIAEIFSEDTP